jgi:hypothetical protein
MQISCWLARQKLDFVDEIMLSQFLTEFANLGSDPVSKHHATFHGPGPSRAIICAILGQTAIRFPIVVEEN